MKAKIDYFNEWKHVLPNFTDEQLRKLFFIMEDYANNHLHLDANSSDLKKELLKAFSAGRRLGKDNRLTSWDEEKGVDIEHSGFEGWYHYHYH